MLGDSSSCLIGLLNLERDCSLANRTYKVQYQFLKCRVRIHSRKKSVVYIVLSCVIILLYILYCL